MARKRRIDVCRRQLLLGGAALWAMFGCRKVAVPAPGIDMNTQAPQTTTERMPVVFVGHGSPMNAIDDNQWSRSFRRLGEALPVPRAVLAVSAHWYVAGTFVTDNPQPETIHDFGGFPQALNDVVYPAPGDPELATRVTRLLGAYAASTRSDWGLDHGTWSVLVHMRPGADVPVLQLSIDGRIPASRHVEIARALSPLRDEGVLILGSGNIVHNLRDAFTNMRQGRTQTPRWASDFDLTTARALEQRDVKALTAALDDELGRAAHPTPEHYLPLLYAFGASSDSDRVTFPIDGFDAGSLSMRSVRFG